MTDMAALAARLRCTRFDVAQLAARAQELTPTVGARLASVPSYESAAMQLVASEFDAGYYLDANPDVAAGGENALTHFMRHGAIERRRPNAWFDTAFYLDANPDVAQAGVNPFWHYLAAGAGEGRRPSRAGGFKRDVLERIAHPRTRTAAYPRPPRPALLSEPALADILLPTRVQAPPAPLVLAVSHDLYLRATGGIQLCIADEQRAFAAAGRDYLQISPFYPDLVLAEPAPEFILSLVFNGRYVGQCGSAALQAVLRRRSAAGDSGTFVVHSLLGHDPARLVELQRSLASKTNLFWLHDYSSICPGFNLLRNDIVFCGAPPKESQACRICIYGEQRAREAGRIRRFFEQIAFTIVAPSEAALAVWRRGGPLPIAGSVVHPHCELRPGAPLRAATRDGSARIAFVGYPTAHKGWPAFRTALALPDVMRDHVFYHFGIDDAFDETPPAVRRVTARTAPDRRTEMVEQLAGHAIDLVFLASPWPETFSYVLHEALAAGVDILTVASSGNIAWMVQHSKRGIVAEDEAALVACIEKRFAAAYAGLCREAAPIHAELAFTGTSATLARAA